jgi:squalene-hopene/tetraprenyl-beta-curcumene cyclase
MNVTSPFIDAEAATQLAEACNHARNALLQARNRLGFWEGRLSSSALSTAVAMVALSLAEERPDLIRGGLNWLVRHQEKDGGFGDTPGSPSNCSTTLLCWAACRCVPETDPEEAAAVDRAEAWLLSRLGSIESAEIAERVLGFYGRDRTFSVPILTLCAVSGRLGSGPGAWKHIPQLPFEMAALPHTFFNWLRLPVVSYAVPALIAMGLARHANGPSFPGSPLGLLRSGLTPRVLKVLQNTQPASGGFLEAIPLTGFVVMALAASGLREHPVTKAGASFLVKSARPDGSWPIDVNLSTWLTTLSVSALCKVPSASDACPHPPPAPTLQWLLKQQHLVEHPFTHASPGGWAWTDLPGGVPDADDTAGTLVALKRLDPKAESSLEAVIRGIQWLLGLQNRDGGIPTFCRGWLNLPFDRSCPDITAHAIAAWAVWQDRLPARLNPRVQSASRRALRYLERSQQPDGTWLPLWFGNQHSPNHSNPVYGTARVLLAFSELTPDFRKPLEVISRKGARALLQLQRPDGGWSSSAEGPASIEETALALSALCATESGDRDALSRGLAWLLHATRCGTQFPPAPIGLYFEKLWYSEELYPVIFSCEAFGRLQQRLNPQ